MSWCSRSCEECILGSPASEELPYSILGPPQCQEGGLGGQNWISEYDQIQSSKNPCSPFVCWAFIPLARLGYAGRFLPCLARLGVCCAFFPLPCLSWVCWAFFSLPCSPWGMLGVFLHCPFSSSTHSMSIKPLLQQTTFVLTSRLCLSVGSNIRRLASFVHIWVFNLPE